MTGADYTEVLVAFVMERRRWRAQYETARKVANEGDVWPVGNPWATSTPATHQLRLCTPAAGNR